MMELELAHEDQLIPYAASSICFCFSLYLLASRLQSRSSSGTNYGPPSCTSPRAASSNSCKTAKTRLTPRLTTCSQSRTTRKTRWASSRLSSASALGRPSTLTGKPRPASGRSKQQMYSIGSTFPGAACRLRMALNCRRRHTACRGSFELYFSQAPTLLYWARLGIVCGSASYHPDPSFASELISFS